MSDTTSRWSSQREDAEEPALLSLMKDVIDALGTLIAGHVRLARAEIGGDARRYARRGAFVAVAASLALVGYALCCVAAALALARLMGPAGPALAFLAIGGVHLVGASAVLRVLLTRPAPRALDETLGALDRTVATLTVTTDEARQTSREPVTETLETLEDALEGGAVHVLP